MSRSRSVQFFAAVLAVTLLVMPVPSAKAQGIGQLANGLVNVQVGIGEINIGDITLLQDLIDIGVINIEDVINDINLNDVDLVDIETVNIENVLNDNQLRVLDRFLNRSP